MHLKFLMHLRGADMFIANVFLCKCKERICALKIPYAFERSGYVHCKHLYASARSGYVH